jgi:ABC-type oligopeptide transport system substrate-binding subunit
MQCTSAPLAPRFRVLIGLAVLVALLLGWLGVAARDQAAQNKEPEKKQRTEEEDDPPAKGPPKRKIRFEEEDNTPQPVRPGTSSSADLGQLAREAKSESVRAIYRKLAVPYDLLQHDHKGSKVTIRVQPLETLYWGEGKSKLVGNTPVTYAQLDAENKPMAQVNEPGGNIYEIKPYEQVALDELQTFRLGNSVSVYEQLVAEEQVVAAVLRWHESAKAGGVRKGNGWGQFETGLKRRLRDVMIQQLKGLTAAKDWDAGFTLAKRVADSFPATDDQQAIAPAIIELLEAAVADGRTQLNITQLRDAHLRLRELIDRFPGDPKVKEIKERLHKQAEALFKTAKALGDSSDPKDLARAQELIRQAEEIDPNLPGLREIRAKIRGFHPVLSVGVRDLPKYMSPNTALTDTELRAEEMIFESLVKFTPDARGAGRYVPCLAEGRPLVIELGRQFQLPGNALWSNGEPLTVADVRATFLALRDGRGPGHSLAWQNFLAEKPATAATGGSRGGNRVNINLNKGYLEPLALMNAKIVPPRALEKGAEDEFGRNPVGSGPFAYGGRIDKQGRIGVKFGANENYTSRMSASTKELLPRFREVDFYAYSNALEVLKDHQLILDLTPEEAAKIYEDRVKNHFLVTPMSYPNLHNHRVYFLAVNNRKPPLDDPNMRAALALAINREALLRTHYRANDKLPKTVHKSLNSLYPARSWACDPKLVSRADKDVCDPFDPTEAKQKFALAAAQFGGKDITLRLNYPAGDPLLEKAMKDLAVQVQDTLGVRLDLEATDVRELRRVVEGTFQYDLAYYHYDFADDTYWLWPLFAPKADGDGNNMFGFKSKDDQFGRLLEESMAYREFDQVRRCTQVLHRIMTQETPVIPLWQLDPLHAISDEVKTTPFDSQRLFTDIEKWRLGRGNE